MKGDKNLVQESTNLEIFLGGGKENEQIFKAIRKKNPLILSKFRLFLPLPFFQTLVMFANGHQQFCVACQPLLVSQLPGLQKHQ